MKTTLLLILIALSFISKGQDTTYQHNGYTICFDSLTVVQDTVNRVSYLYNHYESKVKFSINGSKPIPIKEYCLVVHYVNFSVQVSRKKYSKTYKI